VDLPFDWLDELRLDLLGKLALAVILGAGVGLEREISGKAAGLRTNILICLAATLLMELSIAMSTGPDGRWVGDPARIAAQVISGVGFLGAGTIIVARGTVVGLTSAATIWMVTAIGLAVGAGMFVEAIGATVLVMLILGWMSNLEYRVRGLRRKAVAIVRTRPDYDPEEMRRVLRGHGLRVRGESMEDTEFGRTFEYRLHGPSRQYAALVKALRANDDVLDVQVG
jgi:putative Mg2+ transporter-C (MgtC) family protein